MVLSVEVVESLTAFQALRDDWNAAASRSADPNIFMTWDWLHTWWTHFGQSRTDAELHVVTVRDAEGLVAAAPLFRTQWGYGPLRAPVLHQISYNAGDYGGILLVRRYDEAIDALLSHLAELLRHDARTTVLSRLTTDSVFLATLRSRLTTGPERLAAIEAHLDDACPFTDLTSDYDLAKRQKKHRIRQRMQRLTDTHGPVAFDYHTGESLDAGFEHFVAVHQRRWDTTSIPMQGVLADPANRAFLLDATRALDKHGHVRLLTLTADGRTAAADLDYEYAGRIYMFKTAFDPDFAPFAPGQLLVNHVFEDGVARGIHELDFMRGDHTYKQAWTNNTRHLITVTLTRPGWTGHLAAWQTRAARATTRQFQRSTQRRHPAPDATPPSD